MFHQSDLKSGIKMAVARRRSFVQSSRLFDVLRDADAVGEAVGRVKIAVAISI